MTKRSLAPGAEGTRCSIGRALEVFGDRWSLLILREALQGATKFSDFKDRLHVASDVLSQRLGTLVDGGVLHKLPYQEEGSRSRMAYQLTPAGRELMVVFGAIQQWGDEHCPHPDGPLVRRASVTKGQALRVAFIDEENKEAPAGDVDLLAPVETKAGRPVA